MMTDAERKFVGAVEMVAMALGDLDAIADEKGKAKIADVRARLQEAIKAFGKVSDERVISHATA